MVSATSCFDAWLREESPERLQALWDLADQVRRERVGDAVHLRGLVEVSNVCVRRCAYCGLTATNRLLERYRMTADEVMACARQAVGFGYGTVVLQAGEDPGLTRDWVAALVRRIKAETPLAVTLSLGERSDADLAAWRDAGADRYLLRFETSDTHLFQRIHPPTGPGCRVSGAAEAHPRMRVLLRLRELGYEVGSGVMIGIPGQTYQSLAQDLDWFRRLDLDMIGVGPYIPHPETPLARVGDGQASIGPDQAPATELMAYKVVALSRLVCPDANIPSTTALATLNRAEGRELGLQRGANVVMPNLTPARYRRLYEIYPAKACLFEPPDECHASLVRRLAAIGRTVGVGRGDSLRRRRSTDLISPAGWPAVSGRTR